ncbi:hypothetical protein BPAE_0086g00360 [Botrytis paeoniae]|uniref:Uncharacterized protein n=1 Tax=Botrytis paeoniae TaxID=278948 RepID=A0A4Z1FU31_9HELO|nr:hypothetical protein BPAE_0086g00360 [Botrytis paeoniae]
MKPKEIVSKVKSSKSLSKIKTLVTRKKVTFGPRTWVDYWKDNAPVISASKEFYGLPRAIVELLWTYVIESDEEKQNYYMKPSLVESVYHYDSSKNNSDEGFKVKMTGARTLLRINSFSRSLALKKFCGTLPIFYVPFDDNGILRFDPKRDIIHIQDFHHLAYQMTPTVGMGLMLHIEYKHFAQSTARELLKFHPKYRYIRRLMWMERRTKYIYPFKQRKKSFEARQLARLLNKLYKIHELPGWTWDHSKSIQNLVIDYPSLCKSILIIYQLIGSVHINTAYGAMPQFTAEFGPVSSFSKFLREDGNVQNLRVGDDEWHKLSDDKLFDTMLKGESALLYL